MNPASTPASGRGDIRPHRFPRRERITSRRDYQSTYAAGLRLHGTYVVLFAVATESGHARLGVTATRKIGGAVVRNLLKRRVREVYRHESGRLPAGVDLVVNLRREAATAPFLALHDDLARLFDRLASRRGAPRPPADSNTEPSREA